MKIVVAIKQVPSRDSQLRMNAAGAWIEDADLTWEINEPDAYALEAGLQLREKVTGEVVVICAGPESASQTIREGLAKGADRAIHIETEKSGNADPLVLARMMAKALEAEKPDLILTGLQSDDLGYGQTGVILAEVMGLPHATIIMNIEAESSGIKVKRELEDGWFQNVEMPLPALLTIQSGATKLRYATLMGIKKARTKEVKRIPAAELAGSGASSIQVDRVYFPVKTKHSQIFDGPAKEAAAKLVEKLRFEARVL
ncbi:MAG TPA: electron transfer flavoprotein subunit beta/FixA family protein [Bryobacteraceae bacterium]|jgi:electron transfer flavoprotein beta subunit|nr:electron transfer flavoprotein subunit beta/FixA family protein [Bryobacteraceae bacterium]